MKLVILLSVIACGYAAKLDRTYLPPSSAATAGGNPADLTAPGSTGSLGQGRPNAYFGSAGPTQDFAQNSGINAPSGIEDSAPGQLSGSPSSSFDFNPITGNPAQSGNENTNAGPSGQGFNNFGSTPQSSRAPFGKTPQPNGQAFAEELQPERAQAAADRNAEILKYINENNGDSYEYSYETSNGIAAEESGVATDGVRAQGGYSYTGDDGKFYSITYTADENGYQPQGEHLPTPPPIPEEILKSIEDNARAAAAGTQEGAYKPEEYESDSSPQQYNTGSTLNYNQPQQPIPSLQGQESSNQGQTPQGAFNANPNSQRQPEQVSSLSGSRPQQKPNQFSQNPATFTQNTQPQSFQGSNLFGNQQGQNQKTQGQNGQGLGENGYNYNRPQGNQPQRGQPQKPSQGFGNTNQGLPRQPSTTPFGNQGTPDQFSKGQRGQDQTRNGYNYNQPQKPAQGLNQFSGQRNQQKRPQTFSPSVESNNNDLSSQLPSQTASQSNQQQKQPIRGLNQFNNQPGSNIQDQGDNGYNYNQPQNFVQGSKKFPGFEGQQNTNNGVFGQQKQPTSQINQPQRGNLFGKQEQPQKQYSQQEMAQNQRDNGYNYDRPQNQQGSNQVSGQRHSPSKGAFGQETGSSNQLNQPQQPFKGSNQLSQGQGQNQKNNGYNYNQPKKPTGLAQAFESQSGSPQRISQAMESNDKTFAGALPGQSNGQLNKPQRQPQSSGQRNQDQINQYTTSQKGQDQDENGYYYNQPQSGFSTSQGSSGQRSQQAQSQSPFAIRPSPSYETNDNAQSLKPNQQSPSFQPRPSFSSSGARNQGSQFSEANKQTFGTPSTSPVSGADGSAGSSRPNERYQPNLAPASKFQPQLGSQIAPSQTLAQGYQYNQPEKSQSQRPGFNPTDSQGTSGSAGSEFGGPRQPPSYSAEEGYRY